MNEPMLACHHCGRANDQDHSFCGGCGERLLGPERSGATITAPEGERPPWVSDPVIGLRVRNTLREFELKPWQRQISIGRAPTCDIVLPSEAVSLVHALVERQPGGACIVHDRGSKNGIVTEGGHQRIFELTPGLLFMCGDIPLVAFSAGMQQVRAALQRYLGAVDESHQRGVEDALEATGRRRHVMITSPPGGQAELLARAIHEAGPGARQPCRVVEQIPETPGDQERMFKSATNGTLALRVDSLPPNRERLGANLRRPPYNVRVIAFGASPVRTVGADLIDAETRGTTSIHIPPLTARPRADRMQLISALTMEIGRRIGFTELEAPSMDAMLDYDWPENLAELSETIERMLVFRREDGSQRKAAKALGISRGRWRNWYQRWQSRMRE